MIKYIGKKRLVIIIALAVINVVLVAALFGFVIRSVTYYEREVQGARQEASRLMAQAQDVEGEYKKFLEYQKQYEGLSSTGFFIEQDRFIAKKVLDRFQQMAGLVSVSYSIGAAEKVEDQKVAKISKKLMKSEISAEISAYTDKGIYRFVELVQEAFPGGVQVKSLMIEPDEEVTPENLKSVGAGKPVSFVKGKMVFDWLVLLDDENAGAAGGGVMGAAPPDDMGRDPNMPPGLEEEM